MRHALAIALLLAACSPAPRPTLPGGLWIGTGSLGLADGGAKTQYLAWRFHDDGRFERLDSRASWPYVLAEEGAWSWDDELMVAGVRWPVVGASDRHLELAAADGGRDFLVRGERCPRPRGESAWFSFTFDAPSPEAIEAIAAHADEQGVVVARRTQLLELGGDECELTRSTIALPGVPLAISRLPDAGLVAVCLSAPNDFAPGAYYGVHVGPPMTVRRLDAPLSAAARQQRFGALELRDSVIAAWEETDLFAPTKRSIFVARPEGDSFVIRAIAPPLQQGPLSSWTLLREMPARTAAWLAVVDREPSTVTRFFPVDGDRSLLRTYNGAWNAPVALEADGGVVLVGSVVPSPAVPGRSLLLRAYPLLRRDGSTMTYPSWTSIGMILTEFPADGGSSVSTLLQNELAPRSPTVALFESADGRVHVVGFGRWLMRDASAAAGAR